MAPKAGLPYAVLGFLLALAGCVTEADPAGPAAARASAAPEPTPDDLSGSIAGLVVDDESQPITGADVALTKLDAATKTDGTGAFTLNGIPAGSHAIIVARLGYEQVARSLEVRVGEVTNVTITLKPVAIGEEAFMLTFPRTGHVMLGNVYLYDVVWVVNNSNLNQVLCDACIFTIHTPKSPKAGVTETNWESGTSGPAINTNVWLQIKKDWSQGSSWLDGTVIISRYFADGQTVLWSEAQNGALKGVEKLIIVIYAGEGVTLDLRLTIYSSFAFNGDVPENFTALPPK